MVISSLSLWGVWVFDICIVDNIFPWGYKKRIFVPFSFCLFSKAEVDFSLLKLLIHWDRHLEEKFKKGEKLKKKMELPTIMGLWSFGVDILKKETLDLGESLNTKNVSSQVWNKTLSRNKIVQQYKFWLLKEDVWYISIQMKA